MGSKGLYWNAQMLEGFCGFCGCYWVLSVLIRFYRVLLGLSGLCRDQPIHADSFPTATGAPLMKKKVSQTRIHTRGLSAARSCRWSGRLRFRLGDPYSPFLLLYAKSFVFSVLFEVVKAAWSSGWKPTKPIVEAMTPTCAFNKVASNEYGSIITIMECLVWGKVLKIEQVDRPTHSNYSHLKCKITVRVYFLSQ